MILTSDINCENTKTRTKLIIMSQSQRAPASFNMGTNSPEIWVAITLSSPPSNFPPTKMAGNCGRSAFSSPALAILDSWSNKASSSCSSTYKMVGLTPCPWSKCLMTWHMQQPRRPNTITALSDTIFCTFFSLLAMSSLLELVFSRGDDCRAAEPPEVGVVGSQVL